MQKFVKKIISIIYGLLCFAIILLCVIFFPYKDVKSLIFSIIWIIVLIGTIFFYRKRIIKKKLFYIIMLLFLFLGIGIRLYFINGLSFNLASDFKLAFDSGKEIANGLIPSQSHYLSYNGYFYIFSCLISIIFRIFGVSINAILYTNLILQLLSLYFLYKIISMKFSNETSMFLVILYFLLPSIICINLLVTTENPFLLMMFICIYISLKLLNKKELKIKNFMWFIFLGILLSFTNYIRPAITVFLIAFLIYYILNLSKFKEILLIIILLISYLLSNIGFNYLIEYGLKENIKSGAMGWGIYFGTNYDSGGMWTEKDSILVFNILSDETKGNKELIDLSWKRLKSYGFIKNVKFCIKKYKNLWAENNGVYDFVNDLVDYDNSTISFSKYENIFDLFG
ncbi:MAG: glycosyltransferase family 39 protein [Bacilli bacterium]